MKRIIGFKSQSRNLNHQITIVHRNIGSYIALTKTSDGTKQLGFLFKCLGRSKSDPISQKQRPAHTSTTHTGRIPTLNKKHFRISPIQKRIEIRHPEHGIIYRQAIPIHLGLICIGATTRNRTRTSNTVLLKKYPRTAQSRCQRTIIVPRLIISHHPAQSGKIDALYMNKHCIYRLYQLQLARNRICLRSNFRNHR